MNKDRSINRPAGNCAGSCGRRLGALLLACLLVEVSPARDVEGGKFVLQNAHLEVSFEKSAAGPRLARITHRAAAQTYAFADSEEIALVVLPPDVIHDPGLKVRYEVQEEFQFQNAALDEKGIKAVLRFGHDLVEVEVVYELQGDAPVLRKTTHCRAGEKGAYVAGVSQWRLKPGDLPMAWPKGRGQGQPAILTREGGGCFLTLEWPRARTAVVEGELQSEYRPGYLLAAGASREVAAGSIGFFESSGASRESQLEDARVAFFAHVADRVKPAVPFPVKFTTWGPWLGRMRDDRILEVMDDMAYVGVDLVHVDAGWQHPDDPYSVRLPKVRDADDETWDRTMIQAERMPGGMLPIVREAKARGMKVSLWFDACGNVYVRDGEDWAIRNREGEPVYRRMWETRWKTTPVQSLASPYGERLEEFVLQCLERYDLGGVMFDNNSYTPDFSTERRSLANGWNALDVQLRKITEILDEAERRRPGIYRFYCRGTSWPWALLHATHIHAGDPGTSGSMAEAMATDYPARAMAYERHLAWRRHYDNFVPPWGVKGDIAGWSVQQYSAIPVNLKHTGQLIPSGEGWTQNMFTCFATTAVRDVRFSFRQMPAFDKEILKEWLSWDRDRSRFIFDCRPILSAGEDPNRGIDGYSHVGKGRGVIYLFNRSFDSAEAEVELKERAGFRPGDLDLSAHLVYPLKAPLASGKVSYGDRLRVPLFGKDCAVIEVGLKAPEGLVPYAEYEEASSSVRRSHDTIFLSPAAELFEAAGRGKVRVEVGSSPRDARLAREILDTLGSAVGSRISIGESEKIGAEDAECRLIIGTHEGLSEHAEIGGRFREVFYDRYIDWKGALISAPLMVALPESSPPTFCLIAPRPEQLARLAANLTSELLKGARSHATGDSPGAKPVAESGKVSFNAAVPQGRAVLRFLPVIGRHSNMPLPGDIEMVRLRIEAEEGGRRTLVWEEEIPPISGRAPWWKERVVSVADFAGREVSFHFSAEHVDGREHPGYPIGFRRVALLGLKR